MAVKTDVVLLADAGDVTVARRTAFYTYGKFEVILPEGREQQETDTRLTDGYIARAHDGNVGRFDFGFIRADATVNIDAGTSDLETQIDSAELRAEGDVFFEGDITPNGFNGFVPGVDYDSGDIVTVRRWGTSLALPVTSIELEVSESAGARASRVHVSGQLIHDAASRRRSNDDLRQQIAAEKRERLRQVGAVDAKASGAQSAAESAKSTADTAESKAEAAQGTADTAKEGVDDLTGSLAGPGATQATVDQQMQDLADQLAAQGEEAPPGLIPAYMHANNERWRMQEEINEATDAALIAHGAAIEANEKAIKSLMRGVAGFMHVPTDAGSWSDDRIEVTRSGGTVAVTALDRWRGTVAFSGSHTGQDGVVTPVIRGSTVPDSGGREYSFPSSGQSIVHYLVNPGVVEEREIANLPVQTLANREWVTVLAWDVPEDTDLMVVARWVWVAKTYGGDYWGRIVVNGVDVTDAYTSASAPLFGHGRRVAQVSTQWVEAKSGDVVEVQAQAGHGNSTNRRVDSVRANITTVTDEE